MAFAAPFVARYYCPFTLYTSSLRRVAIEGTEAHASRRMFQQSTRAGRRDQRNVERILCRVVARERGDAQRRAFVAVRVENGRAGKRQRVLR
jgi:hypothetical protein